MPNKKIGIIYIRLGGLDGVSLDVDKWVNVLKKMGWQVFLCAGQVMDHADGYNQVTGESYPELAKAEVMQSLNTAVKDIKRLNKTAFDNQLINIEWFNGIRLKKFEKEISCLAEQIEKDLTEWLEKNQIQKIIVENINCLPVHIPAAVAITNILKKNPSLFALFHHHDFYWERQRYQENNHNARPYLRKYFPSKPDNAVHITINSKAQKDLLKKQGIKSVIIPNVFDSSVIKKDDYNKDFRKDIGLKEDDLFFLAPVRVVHRKNLEAAIKLIKVLDNPKTKLVIAGCVDFCTGNYAGKLKRLSLPILHKIRFICSRLAARRHLDGKKKMYTVFDAYAWADFVLYPTLYEGWGNALGEAMAAELPILVNRYQIFKDDIEPLGFEAVKINNGELNKRTPQEIMELLNNKELREKMTKQNLFLIEKHFSLEVLEKHLNELL